MKRTNLWMQKLHADTLETANKYREFSAETRENIAKAFAEMSETNPESYNAFKAETLAQYRMFSEHIDVIPYFGSEFPYLVAFDMFEDVRKNGRMYFFPTVSGFGMDEVDMNHPLLEKTGIHLHGYEMLYNDLFRVVHDVFGHIAGRCEFDQYGEEKAWYLHSRMYSETARIALFSETLGQSTTVFHNPKNAPIFESLREFRREMFNGTDIQGKTLARLQYREYAERLTYADQKYTCIPKHVSDHIYELAHGIER